MSESTTPTGLVITVGVVLGYAAFNVLVTMMNSFVVPLLIDWRNPDANGLGLSFRLGNANYNYSPFVSAALALVILAAIIFYVFILDDLTVEEVMETRDCPECKNEIWADATRCGFCTAVIEPLLPAGEASGA